MKTVLRSLLLLFVMLSQLAAQDFKKLDTFIEKGMKDWQMPGFSVAIVKNDSVIYAKGFGVTELGKEGKVDENTLFVIASLSKAFTTASIARLVDQGKLKWDDPVIKYLPDFQMYDPWVTKEISIRDLVTHRSGLVTFSGDILWLGSNYDTKEVLRRSRYLKPVSSFRTKYGYSNLMYTAAGAVLEAVTDTSWQNYIKENFFKPLGMKRSVTSITELQKSSNIAKAYKMDGGKLSVIKYYSVDAVAPAAGINSSAIEMAQWIRLQLGKGKYEGKRIFSERQSAEMWMNSFAVGNGAIGLGWFADYYKGKRVLSHGGGMPGMVSNVTLVPEEKFGFVLLSNLENSMTSAVRSYIMDLMLGLEEKDYNTEMLKRFNAGMERRQKEFDRRDSIRVKNTTPSLPLEKYTGIYEDKMYGKAEVSVKDGSLFLQFLPSKEFRGELKHYHYDTFTIDWADQFLTKGWVKFEMDFNADIEKFTIEVPNSPDFVFTELEFIKEK